MSSSCLSDSSPLSTFGTRMGLTLIAQSACLSFIAVVSLLTYLSYIVSQHRRTPGWRLIKSHLDLYLLGLMFSDLVQSIGGMMDIEWVARAGVHEGKFCTAQGVIKQFGDVGVALCSSAIAAHTFAELVLRWKEPPSFTIPTMVLCLYVIFLTLLTGVGYAVHRHDDYYGNTTYWCWITSKFLDDGIGLEYLWLWVAALINLALYVPVFLALKKFIIVEPSERWWRYHVRRTTPEERQVVPRYDDVVKPRRMLFYPAVYIVTVLPLSVTRISSLAHPSQKMPFPALVFAGVLFQASGIFNVIVYTSTRPALLRPSVATLDAPPNPQSRSKDPQLFWSDDVDAENIANYVTPDMTYSASNWDDAGLHTRHQVMRQ